MMQTIFSFKIRIQIAQKGLHLEGPLNDIVARIYRSSAGTD
jgi:hypothetical protein